MRQSLFFVLVGIACTLVGVVGCGKQIHIPGDVQVFEHVIIAETGSFYEKGRDGELVPREFQAWPGDHGWRSADWFDVRIEADRGDVIVLAPSLHKFDLWVFSPAITITTQPNAETTAEIWGTVEIDADDVTLDRIAVTGPRKDNSSGHGIEVNRELISHITIRNCRSAENEWTGIHIIGPRGTIDELRVEDCELVHNGMDGMDAQSVVNLIITGCTITDNGWDFEHGVGVRIGSFVEHVEMHDNRIWGNRLTDVYQKE